MNRLPFGDRTTRRSELAVFASLGLAAVTMVAFAAVQTTRFVAGSDRIAAALSGHQTSLANTRSADAGKTIATNAALPNTQQAGARVRPPGKV